MAVLKKVRKDLSEEVSKEAHKETHDAGASDKRISTGSSRRGRRSRQRYSKKPAKQLVLARKHMISLFEKARAVFNKDPSLADRYVSLARKVAMKFKLRIPSKYKRLYCQHCYRFLVPGKTLRVRVHEHRLIYYCSHCGKFWRKPLKTARSGTVTRSDAKPGRFEPDHLSF